VSLNQVVLWLAIALAAWYFAGARLNRRRANQLARAVYHAMEPVGSRASIRPVGSSAFHIEVDRPARGLRSVQILCLLEARDFPLAWLWLRLRGYRDRFVVKAELEQPPGRARDLRDDPSAGRELGLRRLAALRLQPDSPHVHLAFAVGAGEEDDLARAFGWLGRLARGESEDD